MTAYPSCEPLGERGLAHGLPLGARLALPVPVRPALQVVRPRNNETNEPVYVSAYSPRPSARPQVLI